MTSQPGSQTIVINYSHEILFLKIKIEHCDALRDLVLFMQFKNREKHTWGSVTFGKVACFSLQLY